MDAEYEAWLHEHAFRVYASDTLQIIAKAGGYKIGARYIDLIDKKQPETQKTGDEIIADIILRGGLKVVG